MTKVKTYQTQQLKLSQDLRERLTALYEGSGGTQGMYKTIDAAVRTVDGEFVARVSVDIVERLKVEANRKGDGTWQRWAREALEFNGIDR